MDSLKKLCLAQKPYSKKSLERRALEICSDENWGSANSALHDISKKNL